MSVTWRACDECLARSLATAAVSPEIELLEGRNRKSGLLALSAADLGSALHVNRAEMESRTLPIFDRAERSNLETVGTCEHSEGYPVGLADLDDRPACLYTCGEQSLESLSPLPTVAIVGARRPTPYGAAAARQLGKELSAVGVVVVSGMAFGIDSAAHEGALAGGGQTIAVLAGGPDQPSPASQRNLHERILQAGCVVAEVPPGVRPRKWSFPARNRIIAALAQVTIVVEGLKRSGSLYTADFARELGREVAAVPGQITNPLAEGPNNLIFDGATPVRSTTDVLDLVFGVGAVRGLSAAPAPELHLQAVWTAIGVEPASAPELVEREICGTLPDALSLLGQMELGGWATLDRQGRFWQARP